MTLPTTPLITLKMRNILIGLVILFFFVNNTFSESKSNSGAISHNTFIITCDEEGSKQKKYSVKTENASLSIYQQDDSLVYKLWNSKQEAGWNKIQNSTSLTLKQELNYMLSATLGVHVRGTHLRINFNFFWMNQWIN